MDYKKFRRSDNVDAGEAGIPDEMRKWAYEQAVRQRGYPDFTSEQLSGNAYVPLQLQATPEQLANPMAQQLGMPQIMALVEALRSLEPEKPRKK